VSRRILVFNNVLDLYDRKIIGWSLSSGMSVRNFIGGLENGYKNRSITKD
jgi:transposase InsO family protein